MVLVVGGGNSALITALYLVHIGCEVKIAHRRNVFRAEDALVQALGKTKTEVLWNTEVLEILGEKMVKAVRVVTKPSGKIMEIPFDGISEQSASEGSGCGCRHR
jgi:thioredoxin reductase (NADPH)